MVTIPKVVTAADTAAARAKAAAIREEIVKGAKFEDVAKRESADSVSGALGGDHPADGGARDHIACRGLSRPFLFTAERRADLFARGEELNLQALNCRR